MMNNYQAQQILNNVNSIIGFATSIMVLGFLFGMTRFITKPLGNPNTKVLPPVKKVKGTCYEDAWRFLIKEEEGELIHGSVQLTEEGPRVKHAWVELPTGYIWEPQTGQYFTRKDFRVLDPIEEHRYSVEEAAIMLARVGKHGPWTDEERAKWLRERHSTKTVYITAEAQSAMFDLIKGLRVKRWSTSLNYYWKVIKSIREEQSGERQRDFVPLKLVLEYFIHIQGGCSTSHLCLP